ncbi:MAG TPA: helix-turn-helix domain-containing protein [Prolixibacteraceae bacterium]|nr:helix-turn-helix domain-containing protein [Prolixibacteraceae bacterium]
MSSRLEIEKICEWCSKRFIAKKTTTKYCSHDCNSKAYKSIKRGDKIKKVTEQIFIEESQKPLKQLKERNYFKIAEVALLLGLSRQSVYNMIYSGKLKTSQLSSRLSIVSLKNIEEMLESSSTYETRKVKEPELITEFYSINDIKTKFNVKESWIYRISKSRNIPQILNKGKSYLSKKHVDNYFKQKRFFDNQNIKDWYSVAEVGENYNMTLSAIYSFVSANKIPKKKDGRTVYYSKEHFDLAKGRESPKEPEFYTIAQAMKKYNLTQDSLYAHIRSKNIPKIKEGRFIKISKSVVDRIFEKPIIFY